LLENTKKIIFWTDTALEQKCMTTKIAFLYLILGFNNIYGTSV